MFLIQQWNLDITRAHGTGKNCSLWRGFATLREKELKTNHSSRGELPYKSDGDGRRKILIKTLRKTNVGVATAKNDPEGRFTCVVGVQAFFL